MAKTSLTARVNSKVKNKALGETLLKTQVLQVLLSKTKVEQLKQLKEIVPLSFIQRVLAIHFFGLACVVSTYLHIVFDVSQTPFINGLMLGYLFSFLSVPIYLTLVYPLKEFANYPEPVSHPIYKGLVLVLYTVSVLLLLTGLNAGGNAYALYILIILAAAPAGVMPLNFTIPTILISNAIVLLNSLEHINGYFSVFLVGGQFVVMLLFGSLFSEFRNHTQLKLNMAELTATQSLLRDIIEQETKIEVARNLHDEIGHLITVIIVNLNRLIKLENQAAPDLLIETQQLTKQLMAEIRSAVLQLRNDDTVDLAHALKALKNGISSPQVHVSFESFNGICSPRIGEVIFRACQESLTNAMRHSTASHVYINIRRLDTCYQVDIEDDGDIIKQWSMGNGLNGLKERTEQLLGTLRVKSEHSGFKVSITLPY